MNLIQILLLAKQLIELITQLKDQIAGDTAFTMAEGQVAALAAQYPELAAEANASGQTFADLIKYLIENGDQIVELIRKFKDLIDAFKN